MVPRRDVGKIRGRDLHVLRPGENEQIYSDQTR